jgi:outer membrane protein OmpA-like peptidoglycan-associated protein
MTLRPTCGSKLGPDWIDSGTLNVSRTNAPGTVGVPARLGASPATPSARISGRNSKWWIVTSSNVSIGKTVIVVSGGGTAGRIYVSADPKVVKAGNSTASSVAVLEFIGAGAGVSISLNLKKLLLPIDVSFSTASMPSSGEITIGPTCTNDDLELDDLTGLCVIRVISANAVFSFGATFIFFGPVTTAIPHICKAIGRIFGVGTTTPTPGVSAIDYVCYVRILHRHLEILESREIPIQRINRPPIFQNIPSALTLPSDALFGFGSAKLRTDAVTSLEKAIPLITDPRVRSVLIEGHTDSIGTANYNLRLSEARAAAVKNWFIHRPVPNASGFATVGMGATDPIAKNTKPDGTDDPEGRQTNRRVAIVLSPLPLPPR